YFGCNIAVDLFLWTPKSAIWRAAVYRHFQRFSSAWSVVSAPRAAKLCTAKKRQQQGSFAVVSLVTVRVAATGARQVGSMWGTRKHELGWASGLRVLGQPGVMIAIFNRTLSRWESASVPGPTAWLVCTRRTCGGARGKKKELCTKWWLDSGRRWAGIPRRDLRCELFWNTWSWKAGYSIAVAPPKTQSTRS
ncbi:unnamed protein product, partial [Ectocarpus sp. 8 AP-2014]